MAKSGWKGETRVNRWSDPHLLSLSNGARRVVVEEAASRLCRAADEVATLKRSVFGRRPMCHVFCSPCRCIRQTSWRIKGSVCDVHTTIGGASGFAMVWDREGRQHRVTICVHGSRRSHGECFGPLLTTAITTSRGEYLGLCVLLKRRLVGALGRPCFGC